MKMVGQHHWCLGLDKATTFWYNRDMEKGKRMYKFVIQRDSVQSVCEFEATEDQFFDLEWFDTQEFPWEIDISKFQTPKNLLLENPSASFIWQNFIRFYKDGEGQWLTTIMWYKDGELVKTVKENV